ncbi:tyrosine-type recombinase/integrase [Methanosarcina hadiensis]|uniref:tyrosine-type recombinase/integrase n=1 Tax=Methanosarcina hadiensis TaxID=3078083 RepID=UPI0039772BD6
MKIEDLRDDGAVKNWFVYVKPKPLTEKSYLNSLKLYCDFVGKTPDELIAEADKEAEDGVLLKRRKIKQYFTNYIDYLNKSENSGNTIKLRLAVIKSFYKKNDVELPSIPRNEDDTCLEGNLKIPTKEELQEVLKECVCLKKAIILAGVSSGLSSNEIRNLKINQFKNGYDPETEITTLPLRREKTKVDFITFFSPEASKAIWDYLKFRNNRTSKRKDAYRERQLEKQRGLDDGYLFINSRVQKEYVESGNDEDRKLKRNTFMEIYRSISEKCNMNAEKGKYNLIRSHNLRRYFYSALTNNGCNHIIAEFLMGHKLSETEIGYYRANPLKLREQYQKYVPYLTIQKELDISVSPEFQKLQEENENLKTENYRVNVEREEIKRIKTDVDIKLEDNEKQLMRLDFRNKIQLLKMRKKYEPKYAEKIQEMIDRLQNSINILDTKDYKDLEYIEDEF